MKETSGINYQKKDLPGSFNMLGWVFVIIGAVLLALSYYVDHDRAAFNTTIMFMFILSIGLGSLFFVALEYLVGAVWSVPFRRIGEFMAALLIIAPLLAIPIIMNMHGLFHWTHMEDVIADPFLSKKVPYLNEPFFIIRTLIFFVVMILFFFVLAGRSLKQDKTGDYRHTKTNKVASALFMPFFAIFTTIIAIDYLMTLEPHWFSTIFGVYYFAGTFLAALAVLTYVSVTLSEAGYMTKYINNDHYYNFGALMFAFVNFWAYIAFSQFLLIWYANIPEETFWFIDRWQGSWMWVTIGLIFIHFIVPYAVLLSQPSKRNPKVLKFISIWIIIAHFYDLYWIVMPTYSHDNAILGWMELMVPILPVGLLLVVFNFMAKRKNLIPVNDPKIKSGLRFRL